jgi:hypothetical protein
MPTSIVSALPAVASLAGGIFGADAASSAGDAQAAAANRAADLQNAQYKQTREDLAPYRDQGLGALNMLRARAPELTAPFAPTMDQLAATPGYQFALREGLKGVGNSAAARGLGVSGAALKGAARFATGLADNTMQTQFNIDQANKTNAFNKLLSLVGSGQSAASGTGQFGQAAAANAGNYLTSGAAAQAAGGVGMANAIGGGLNNAANGYVNYTLANRLLGGSGGAGSGFGAVPTGGWS